MGYNDLVLTLPHGQIVKTPLPAVQQDAGTIQLNIPGSSPEVSSRNDYTFPDLRQRPRGTLRMERIYMPVAVSVKIAANPPTQVDLGLYYQVVSEIRWSHFVTLPLRGAGSSAALTGSTIISDDLVNPIELASHESGVLTYSVVFDQAVDTEYTITLPAQVGQYVAGNIYATYEPD